MGVIKNIVVRATADMSNLVNALNQLRDRLRNAANDAERQTRRMSDSTRHNLNSMSSAINGVKGKLALLAGAFLGLQGLKMATEDAMRYDAMLATLNGRLGGSAKAFQEWANVQGRALGYSKMQIAEYGNTFSNMLMDTASSEEDLAKKTQDMMKATAIITSKTGMEREEVLRRMRSAMNMEADGADELGIDVRASAVKTSEAYKKLGDGRPLAELSGALRKTILQQYILEQVTKRYGTTLADNVANRNAQFVASLADLRLALGQAVLPIWNAMLPALTQLSAVLSSVLRKVRLFMEVLFGKASSSADATVNQTANMKSHTNALNDASDAQDKLNKKKKEAGDNLQSFDEVHTLSKPSSDDETPEAGDGAGGLGKLDGTGIADMTEKFSAFDKKVQEIAGKFKKLMAPVIAVLKEMGAAIKDYLVEKIKEVGGWWEKNGAMIQQAMKNVWTVLYPIFRFIVQMIWGDIKTAIDGLLNLFMGIVTFLAGVFTGDWTAAWEGLKQALLGALEAAWGIINLLFYGKIIKGIRLGLVGIVELFKTIGPKLKGAWSAVWKFFIEVLPRWLVDISTPIRTKFIEIGVVIENVFMKAWKAIVDVFKDSSLWFYNTFIKPVTTNFALLWDTTVLAAQTTWNAIVTAFNKASEWFTNNVITPIKDKFTTWKKDISTIASDLWTAIKTAFTETGKWFLDNVITPIKDKFVSWKSDITTLAGELWTAIKGKFTAVGTWFLNNVTSPIKEKFDSVKSDVISLMGEAWEGIKGKFATVAKWLTDNVVTPVKTAFNSITDGLGNAITNGFRMVYNKAVGFLNSMISMLNKAISGMNKLPGVSISTIDPVPTLARGGIVGGRTDFGNYVAGEAGAEMVVPLENTSFVQKLAGALGTAVMSAMRVSTSGQQGGGDVVIQMDGTTLGRVLNPYLAREGNRTGSTMLKVT